MAKRLLLTLLALFGLAAQLAPAQARVGAGTSSEVGGVLLAAAEAGVPAIHASPTYRPSGIVGAGLAPAAPILLAEAPAEAPVRTGIDRARE